MITSLHRLSHEIHSVFTSPDMFQTIRPILIRYQGKDWLEHINHSATMYTRKRIYTCPIFDMFILTWPVYSGTEVHKHAEYGCWLKVLQGRLLETIYEHGCDALSDHRTLDTEQISFIHNSIGPHSIHNTSNATAVSLHIYAPSLTDPTIV
jgi:cysteine dioxygenase